MIDHLFAVLPTKANGTGTDVGIDLIEASPIILTGIRRAVVNVHLTVGTCGPIRADARIATRVIHACPSEHARSGETLVDVCFA